MNFNLNYFISAAGYGRLNVLSILIGIVYKSKTYIEQNKTTKRMHINSEINYFYFIYFFPCSFPFLFQMLVLMLITSVTISGLLCILLWISTSRKPSNIYLVGDQIRNESIISSLPLVPWRHLWFLLLLSAIFFPFL